MRKMKQIVLAVWMSMIWLMGELGNLFASISTLTDWSLLGWAFGGATAFVAYEAIQNKIKRKGWQRVMMIGLGMFIGMAFNSAVAKKLDIDKQSATTGLALLGYLILGKAFKKAEKAESLKDVTDLIE